MPTNPFIKKPAATTAAGKPKKKFPPKVAAAMKAKSAMAAMRNPAPKKVLAPPTAGYGSLIGMGGNRG